MTDYTTFQDNIRDWVGRKDFSDALVTSFIRMAETSLTQSLRVREMVVTADALLVDNKVALPYDWVEAEFVRFTNGKPCYFLTNSDFYDGTPKGADKYTILGSEIEFGKQIDPSVGLSVTMSYYQQIPSFTDVSTWLHAKYYNIFLQSCNAAAALYSQEIERAATLNEFVGTLAEAANATYRRGKVSGSVLKVSGGKAIGGGYRSR